MHQLAVLFQIQVQVSSMKVTRMCAQVYHEQYSSHGREQEQGSYHGTLYMQSFITAIRQTDVHGACIVRMTPFARLPIAACY